MTFYKKLFVFIFLSFFSCKSTDKLPTAFEGEVTSIIDGDTIDVLYNDKSYRIRFADIDCPENDQPFGDSATEFVSKFCFSETVTIENEGEWDMYGRLIGTVIVKDTFNVNFELVRAGLAWHYKRYSDRQEFADIEAAAREKRIMLWSDSNPIPPWDWR
jgi:micrococcal nuclease